MGKYFRTNLEFASLKECRHIAAIDASRMVSNDPTIMYVESNLLTYYVAINTWLAIIEEWSQYGWISVLECIKDRGLIAIISEFDAAAYQIIKGEQLSSSLARGIYHDVYSTRYVVGVAIDPTKNAQIDPLTAILQICRYLKRFSPNNASALRKATLDSYAERARILARSQRQIQHSRFIITAVRDAIHQFINWDGMCDELEQVDISDIIFTSGTSFDTDRALVSKLRRVAERHIEYFPIPFGIPLVANKGHGTEEKWGYYKDIPLHVTRIVPVPKNYKTARIVAPEDVIRQGIARRYFVIMDKWLRPDCGITLHDQSGNQRLAAEGSRTGMLATLDLSNASDSITATLLAELFPTRFVHIMRKVLPTHVILNGKRYLIQTAAPMGNGVTFWLLSTICRNIALAAVRYYNLFTGGRDDRVAAYGDDVIVPTEAAQTVIEWFEALGFEVNRDKSYCSPELRYRESCGEEYLNGCCTTTIYYPRFPILGGFSKPKKGSSTLRFLPNVHWDGYSEVYIDTLTSLVELQHKLFFLSRRAAAFVADLVREAEPRMTCSYPPSDFTGQDGNVHHSDLFDYREDFRCRCAPGRNCVSKRWCCEDLQHNQSVCRGDTEPWVRKQHLVPIAIEATGKCDSYRTEEEDYLLVKLYNYQQFLKYGPRYATELDRLLGVSEPPISVGKARGSIRIKWVYMG